MNTRDLASYVPLSEETKKLFDAISPSLNLLKIEINKVIAYWRSHHEEEPIKSVIVSGRESLISGALDFLSKGTGVNFESANVWLNVCHFDQYVPPILAEDSFDYAVAIGLAIKD